MAKESPFYTFCFRSHHEVKRLFRSRTYPHLQGARGSLQPNHRRKQLQSAGAQHRKVVSRRLADALFARAPSIHARSRSRERAINSDGWSSLGDHGTSADAKSRFGPPGSALFERPHLDAWRR